MWINTQCTVHYIIFFSVYMCVGCFFFHCDVPDRPSNIELSFILARPALPINYMLNMMVKNSFYVPRPIYIYIYIYMVPMFIIFLDVSRHFFNSPYFNELAKENFWHFIVTKEIYMLWRHRFKSKGILF